MGSPFFLVENLFSQRQFPAVTVTADEEPAGYEAFRVADGRRSNLDYATATTANDPWWVKAACDRLRGANACAIDRGHNLAGLPFSLQCSQDDFTTTETIFTVTMPAAATPAGLDTLGARTFEGAWIVRFPFRAASYWRLYVPAMGASLVPRIVGLTVGMGYVPPDLSLPVGFGSHDLVGPLSVSDVGWQARGASTQQRSGTLRVRCNDVCDYELAQYHLEGHYGAGRPMWVVPDDANAQDAFQVVRRGPFGFMRNPSRFYPEADVPYLEHEPALAA